MQFLIDENLTPDLMNLAQGAGHHYCAHVTYRGWGGEPDHVIMRHALENEFVIVTRNARDFRAENGRPGLYDQTEIHPGLVCIVARVLDAELQKIAFQLVLDYLAQHAIIDLTNRGVDINMDVHPPDLKIYDLPSS